MKSLQYYILGIKSRITILFQSYYYNLLFSKNAFFTLKSPLYHVKFDIKGKGNKITINEGCKISNVNIFIRGNGHELIFMPNSSISGGSLWFQDNNCKIIINEKTTIENAHLAVTENDKKIIIGRNCMMSHNIEMRTGDSHAIYDIETNERINCGADVIIENNVWLGAHVKVLKGTIIKSGTVVGIQSVVSGIFGPDEIIGGIPARVIKTGIRWTRQR